MKKIWIINQYASPPDYEVRVRNNMMAHYLIEKGYDVTIISGSMIHNTDINLINDNAKFVLKEYDDLKFIHIKTSSYKGNGFKRVWAMLEFPIKLCRLYKKIDNVPDLLICDLDAIFFPFVNHIAKKIKRPIYLEVRDLWPASIAVYKGISDRNILMRLLYKVEKQAYIKCDKLIFSMAGGYEYIKDKGWGKYIDHNKVHYINNGVDLATFEYNINNYMYEDDAIKNDENFKVFYVGSIRVANGVRNIADIARIIEKKNENISFYIFGEGNEKEEIIEYCKKNNIKNIHFKGGIDKKVVPSVLKNSDLNIIHFKDSPLKNYGASLNKLFEYLASGKPILCDCVFYKDIVNENECGFSLNEQDPEILADKIIEIKNMKDDDYKQMCDNCIKTSRQYDYSVLTDKLELLIQKDI